MKSFNEAERIEENQESLNILIHLLTYNIEEFSLTFACCNYQQLQHKINQQLQAHCPAIEIIDLDPEIDNLYSNLDRILGDQKPQGLMVSGLDHLVYLADVLQATKHAREEFRKFKFPVILWMNDRTLQTLIRSSHDFYSWGTSVRFFAETDELIDLIKNTGDRISQRLLDHGAGIFLDNQKLGLETGVNYCQELDTAHHELQERGVEVPLELIANVEFILGRGSDHSTEMTLNHYQRSLELWQQLQNPVHCALLSYHIGLWWRNYAVLHRPEEQRGCEQAATYFQQSIETFEQANHPDLAAKFINACAEALHYLKDWETLETVINHAITLHQAHSNGFPLARGYGFLAEVKVAYSQYREAQDYAKQALELLEANLATETEELQIDWERSYHQGWYLFSLAKAQQGLGKNREAIATLEAAKERTNPNYDHQLYIAILERLHQLYFNQKDYLKAFNIKQYQRQTEQQFGLRAFVGANYLQEFTFNLNPLLPHRHQPNPIQTHITAWGREQDINELMERIRRQDHKLTIIYGESGVGKSSILQAGLIPALTNKTIEAHRVIPILQRVYVNWKAELSQHLTVSLQKIPNLLGSQDLEQVISFEQILNQLRQNSNRGLITVIIFDQFEEFFFEYQTTEERQEFYQLIQSCFELPYIKIIFSLRQDYLYHLLECSRLSYLNGIQNNILDKNIIYYLGNFSISEAQTVIQDLTNQAQLNLEPDLIDQLVKDLGKNYTEIRPIELQITGSQLETDKIKTLEQYQELGSNPKEELVEKFLEHTVIDCGAENQQTAQLILYLLTNENNTRPMKTKTELAEELTVKSQKLNLVLKILTGSGLLLQIPAVPEDRYQLVHDYLVPFIRQKYQPLSAELQRERQQRQRWQKRSQWFSVAAFCLAIGMTLFGLQANQERKKAIKESIISQAKEAKALSFSGDHWEARMTAMQAVQQLQDAKLQPINQLSQVTDSLRQTLYKEKANEFREFNRLTDYDFWLSSIAFSPNAQTIASASGDTVKLWNIQGQLLQTLRGHQGSVNSVAFSPDGQIIVSASSDNTVKLWSIKGELLHTLTGHQNRVFSVAFSPDGQTIASASADKTVKLWTLDGELIQTLEGHQNRVFSVAFSLDGQTIASASADKTVKLWTLDGKLIQTLEGHQSWVNSVAFSLDGQTIASASGDKTIKLWTLDGKLIQTLEGHQNGINSVAFSLDGQTIASGSWDTTVKLWTLNGQLIQSLEGHQNGINSVAFSPNGQTIASTSWDATVKLWTINGERIQTIQAHQDAVNSIVFSPDGQTIASASADKTVKLWTLNGQLIQSLEGHQNGINSVVFSPDGQTIASASADKTVKLWTLNGQLIQTFKGHQDAINTIAFSPDGQTIASASGDKTVKLWTLNGQLIQSLEGHQSWVNSVAFSPDSQAIASGSWDTTVKLWNLDGDLIQTIEGHKNGINSIAFSPDSQTIASASADKTVKLWTLNGELIQDFETEQNDISHITFSSNGQIIASVGYDKTVKIWNIRGQLLHTFKNYKSNTRSVAFSPDGQAIAFANENKKIKLLELSLLDDLIQLGCKQLDDYLTTHPQELEKLNICLTDSRRKVAANAWVRQGEKKARDGEVQEAIATFRKALAWNSDLKLNPEAKANTLAEAEKRLEQGTELAKQGKIEEAIIQYKKAMELNSTLRNIDPEAKAKYHAPD